MAGNKNIPALTPSTAPENGLLYLVKAGSDYSVVVGGDNGLAYTNGDGVVPADLLGSGASISTKFLRGDNTWQDVAGGGGGSVTSVAVSTGTGLSVTGSPITTSGTFAFSLSSNLQAWSALATSAKANASHTHALSDLTQSSATSGQVPTWSGSAWVPQTPSGGGGGGGSVTSVGVSVGTGMSVTGTPVTTSGTIGVSLNSNLQGWSAIATSAKADASHTHTATDIVSGTIATARLGSGTADSTTFLRGDGSWQAPPGGGGGGGTVTSVGAIGSTGLSISGSPVTTSGSITYTLSANLQSWSGIAPSAKADTSHTHAATDITSGTMSPARLGSGTATSSKFLRGDSTWQDFTSGTVTSVALSGGTTGLSVSGSPITTSGAMTLGGVLAVANGGTGGSTAANGRNGLGIYVQSADPGAVADGSLWIW